MNELAVKINKTLSGIKIRPMSAILVEEPASINCRVRQLSLVKSAYLFEIACYLYVISSKKLWQTSEFCHNQEGYASFTGWAWGELGIARRKVAYLKGIIERLLQLNVSEETLRELLKLGWYKAAQILRVADSVVAVQEWCDLCVTMSEREVAQTVKLALATDAKKVKEAEQNGEVIEGTLSESEVIKETIVFEQAEDFALYKKVQGKVEQRLGSSTTGKIIGLICAHYLSSTFPGDGVVEVPAELEHKLNGLEQAISLEYGVDVKIGVSNAPTHS